MSEIPFSAKIRQLITRKIQTASNAEIMAAKADVSLLEPKAVTISKTDDLPKEDVYYTNSRSRGKLANTARKQAAEADMGAYVHVHQIIASRAFWFDEVQSRYIMSLFHPWYNAIIYKIAEHLCMENPIFAMPQTEADEEPSENEQIIQYWNDHRLQEAFQKAIEKGRWGGWCIYYPVQDRPPWYSGPDWHIYTMDEARPIDWSMGHPIVWEIKPTNRYIAPFTINISQCVFFDPNNTDDFDGMPEGSACWDDMIDYVFIQDARNAFDQRLGNGFLTLVVPQATSDADIRKYEAKIKHLRTEQGLVVRGAVEEPVTIDWMNMAGAQVAFTDHLNDIREDMSLASRFPKRWLLGDSEGAMESSGKDALQVNIELKTIFKKWVPFIKNVLKYHSLIQNWSDINIIPPFEMQLSEQEKVELESIKTNTLVAKLAYLSPNEVRELDGYKPAEGGDKIAAQQQKEQSDKDNNDSEGDKPPSDENKSDSYNLLKSIVTNTPKKELKGLLGVGTNTINNIRDKFKDDEQLKLKCDSLALQDSVQLAENIYEIRDAVLIPPQKKFYEQYNKYCIRSPDEIKKVFTNPALPKEFRIGVTPTGGHESSVPLEVLEPNTVGTVKFTRLDENGAIRGNIRYDLDRADSVLGKNNWIRDNTIKGLKLQTSVALRTQDKAIGDDAIEEKLDIRSFVFTQSPRNNQTGGI